MDKMIIKAHLILICILSGVAQAEDFKLKSPQDLGFTTRELVDSKSTQQIFTDQKSKHQLIFQYSSQNQLESIEEIDSLGRSVEKTRYLPDRIWKLTDSNRLDEWITTPGKTPVHRVSFLDSKEKSYTVPFKKDLDQTCSTNQPTKSITPLVSFIQKENSHIMGKTPIKTNKGCAQYPGGETGLLKEMQSAINEGLECMQKSSVKTKTEAMKLLGFFQNPNSPIQLLCGKGNESLEIAKSGSGESVSRKAGSSNEALSLVPPEKGAPGMLINIESISGSKLQERKNTLFHESLHWLGILHSEAFDTPYLAADCCLPADANSDLAKKSCSLLNQEPRPWFYSSKYMSEFTDLMLLQGRASVAKNLVASSVSNKMAKYPPVSFESEYDAMKKLVEDGNTKAPVYLKLMKNLDPKQAAKAPLMDGTGSITQAVNVTASMVAVMYQKSKYEDFEKSFNQMKSKFKELIKTEKDPSKKEVLLISMSDWMSEFNLLSFDVPEPVETGKKWPYELWDDFAKELEEGKI